MRLRRTLAASAFAGALLGASLAGVLVAQRADAHDGTATVDCTTGTFDPANYPPGPQVAHARLIVVERAAGTVHVHQLPGLTFDGPDGPPEGLSWPIGEHTGLQGLLGLRLEVRTDADGGRLFPASAVVVCLEAPTTTSSTTTTGPPETTTTTTAPASTTTSTTSSTSTSVPPSSTTAPPAGDQGGGGPGTLPRTGTGTTVLLAWAGACLLVLGAGLARTGRRRAG